MNEKEWRFVLPKIFFKEVEEIEMLQLTGNREINELQLHFLLKVNKCLLLNQSNFQFLVFFVESCKQEVMLIFKNYTAWHSKIGGLNLMLISSNL